MEACFRSPVGGHQPHGALDMVAHCSHSARANDPRATHIACKRKIKAQHIALPHTPGFRCWIVFKYPVIGLEEVFLWRKPCKGATSCARRGHCGRLDPSGVGLQGGFGQLQKGTCRQSGGTGDRMQGFTRSGFRHEKWNGTVVKGVRGQVGGAEDQMQELAESGFRPEKWNKENFESARSNLGEDEWTGVRSRKVTISKTEMSNFDKKVADAGDIGAGMDLRRKRVQPDKSIDPETRLRSRIGSETPVDSAATSISKARRDYEVERAEETLETNLEGRAIAEARDTVSSFGFKSTRPASDNGAIDTSRFGSNSSSRFYEAEKAAENLNFGEESIQDRRRGVEARDRVSPLSFRSKRPDSEYGATDTSRFSREDLTDVAESSRIDRQEFSWSNGSSGNMEEPYETSWAFEDSGQRKRGGGATKNYSGEASAGLNISRKAAEDEKREKVSTGARPSIKEESEQGLRFKEDKWLGEDRNDQLMNIQRENSRGAAVIVSEYVQVDRSERILKRSKLMAKQIVSQSSALSLGFVSQVWVDPQLVEVVALEVRPSLLSSQVDGVFINNVSQVGDVILVKDESIIETELNMLDCEALVGYDILSQDGYYLGKVRDYSFSFKDGRVTSLEYDSLGVSLIPSNMVSTYCLPIGEVLEVSLDSMLVKRGAETRVRRLTKGIWQLPSVQGPAGRQRLTGISKSKRNYSIQQDLSEMRRETRPQVGPLPPRKASQNYQQKIRTDGDRRWLPMDYSSDAK